jgi:P27 family predicted phage terminase small subunit
VRGREPEVAVNANAIAEARPPAWLSKHAKAEFRRVMPELAKRRILTPADLGCLESYCIAIHEIELLLRAGIDPKLCRMQDKAMVTARQLADNPLAH